MMVTVFEQGWAARPFKEQFPELSDKEAERLDKINAAITLLLMADLLTFSQTDSIRKKKMPKVVSTAIAKARVVQAEAHRAAQATAQGGE